MRSDFMFMSVELLKSCHRNLWKCGCLVFMDSTEFDGMYQVLVSFKQCDSDNASSRYYMLFLIKNPFISTNYEAFIMTKRLNRKKCALPFPVRAHIHNSTEFDCIKFYLRSSNNVKLTMNPAITKCCSSPSSF